MNNEQDEAFEKVVVAVVRIIFGDDNLTDMNVRLVRIALERYNVPEIINSPVGSVTNRRTMDLIRSQFRPQVECEMRCAQSQDLRVASPINLTGLEPAVLFFFPLTVSSQSLPPPSKKPTRSSRWHIVGLIYP